MTARINGQAPERELERLCDGSDPVRPQSASAELWRGPVVSGWPTQRLSLSGSPAPITTARPALACPLRWPGAGPAPRAAAADPGLPDPGRCGRRSRSDHHQAAGPARAGEIAEIALPELRAIKPGTLLVREWEGTLERVVVLESGFAWNGVTYESLSKVARCHHGHELERPSLLWLRDRARAS